MDIPCIIAICVFIFVVCGIASASGDEDGCGCLGGFAGIVAIILFIVLCCTDGCNSKKPAEKACHTSYAGFVVEPQREKSISEEVDEFEEFDDYAHIGSVQEPQQEETPSDEVDEFDDCVYTGPAGEPRWEGTLPEKVNNYTEPRYVYENLVESVDFLPKNGRIIGYRISPSLVIHSRVKKGVNPSVLGKYVSRFGGKLLQEEDIALLRQNWEQISKLREKAGDTSLVAEWFWAQSNSIPVAYHYEEDCYKDVIGNADASYLLILKR